MKKIIFLLALSTILYGQQLLSQSIDDRAIFEQYKSTINSKHSIDKLIVETGKFLLEKPYVANTLEVNDTEALLINLRELDCATFVEATLALAKTAKSNDFSYRTFCSNLTKIRYRNGTIDQYPSRLHYFSDWIFDNEKKGLIKDITNQIGGDSIRFEVSFMSHNPDKYKALKAHPEFVSTIADQESKIKSRLYFYIPNNQIAAKCCKIKSGDIIAITTKIKGLDIGHVGFAIWQKKKLYFMHASSALKKVIISEKPLAEYVNSVKSNSGIIVLRPQ